MCAKRAIVTGGAGFIGSNTARRLIAEGWRVLVIDNLSRPGAEKNLEWLRGEGPLDFERVDLSDFVALGRVVHTWRPVDAVIHLAAQVAVTRSIADPRRDFDDNALGTFNLLEAVRTGGEHPVVIYASTNKVYGVLEWLELAEGETRWSCPSRPEGLDETAPMDFHSPYGCSKGAADQYVHDYARIYRIPTVVLRQSCIYGPRQFGVEDQGWVAWFLIAVEFGHPLVIYGDGKQVRDVLWVDDLVDLYLRLAAAPERVGGGIFNVGGGAENALSLVELLDWLRREGARLPAVSHSAMRPGDQRWFVADTGRLRRVTAWEPRTGWQEGLKRLKIWIKTNRSVIAEVLHERLETGHAGQPAETQGLQS